ncbi:PDZ domain-containing protein [Anoxybacillus calidus]|uniref:endopeptidase La n=1 Tax=[Anoxybacillus] calidus TaxID=575178 RepID=A0A7W0BTZ0_9BACL|nr:SepM family pheromone-processing serine protease [Anoxybacillus calidus]MBA2870696.1 PDZ domain-containing protein [Anoxybacillus calidus]
MKKRIYLVAFSIGAIMAVLLTFIKLPYYVTMPGTAQKLDPLVHVKGGDQDDGDFMLTTIRMGRANVISYALAKVRKYYDLYPVEAIKQQGESDEEYTLRQLHMMENSKQTAIAVAYEKAGKPITYKFLGVYVIRVLPDMPASQYLRPGDRIVAVDEKKLQSAEQFIEYVGQKAKGETVKITFERKGKKKTVQLALKPFPENPKRVGIGISLVTDSEIVTNPSVEIKSEEIGGPSAGLMFSLEIYDQLVEEDITKGYTIAGTGTINEKGEVGPIGGISQKIIAADKAGADIFFAPNEKGAEDSNYQEALKTAKDIGTKMKIVPIDTFDDALRYLQTLK